MTLPSTPGARGSVIFMATGAQPHSSATRFGPILPSVTHLRVPVPLLVGADNRRSLKEGAVLRIPPVAARPRLGISGAGDLLRELSTRVVGQAQALMQIVPYVQMHQAGLSPDGRPAGVFLLLGPTGTGKTRTVEALADALHGSEKHMLKVDCGEFQTEHELAKLSGAPPGYLAHSRDSADAHAAE